MRNRRIRGAEEEHDHADRRPQAPRVPRLRLGGRLDHEREGRRDPEGEGEDRRARAGDQRAPAGRQHRHRAHAVGDARSAERDERASASRLHRHDLGRAQRHHRELRPAARDAPEDGAQVRVGDRHRGAGASHRGGVRRESRGGGDRRARARRGDVRHRRDLVEGSGQDRRGAEGQPAADRPR